MARIEIEYQYTVAFARRTAVSFLRRYGRRAFALAGILFVIGVARVLTQRIDGLAIAFLLIPLLIPVTWAVSIRRATKLARSLGDHRIVIVLDEEGIAFETTERRSFISWPSLKEVWKLRDVWLVFPYGAGAASAYTAIPVEAMTPDAMSLMSRKMHEHGTIVRT